MSLMRVTILNSACTFKRKRLQCKAPLTGSSTTVRVMSKAPQVREILTGGKALCKKEKRNQRHCFSNRQRLQRKAPVSSFDDSLTSAALRTNECLTRVTTLNRACIYACTFKRQRQQLTLSVRAPRASARFAMRFFFM